MGTRVEVIATDVDPALEQRGIDRLRELERRWTRFSPDSELSRLNAASGRVVVVSRETYAVVERAIEGWQLTAGRFDPTVLDAVIAAGYDRSFEMLSRVDGPAHSPLGPVPGCGSIDLFPGAGAIRLPAGVHLDLGGVAKGWAADVVVRELLAAGAAGACVNVGGDLRVAGHAPTGDGWVVAVEDPHRPGAEVGRIQLLDGGIATSSRVRRQWHRQGQSRHHVIDPRTGTSAGTDVAAVTVVAGDAWLAEVLATALLLDPDPGLVLAHGASALVIGGDGVIHHVGEFEAAA